MKHELTVGDVVIDCGRIGIITKQEIVDEEYYSHLLFPKYEAISPPRKENDFEFLMSGRKLANIMEICHELLSYEKELGNLNETDAY